MAGLLLDDEKTRSILTREAQHRTGQRTRSPWLAFKAA
jgi:hypothetical protein